MILVKPSEFIEIAKENKSWRVSLLVDFSDLIDGDEAETVHEKMDRNLKKLKEFINYLLPAFYTDITVDTSSNHSVDIFIDIANPKAIPKSKDGIECSNITKH